MSTEPIGIQPVFKFGEDFELNLRAYELRRGGQTVKLEPTPFQILVLLVEQRGSLVTRPDIVERIWGKGAFLDTDNSINGAIRKIRQALNDDPENARFIQTVTGRGYRFVAPIVADSSDKSSCAPIEAPASISDTRDLSSVATENPASGVPGETELKGRHTRTFSALVVVAVVLIASIAGYWLRRQRHGGEGEGLQLSRFTDNRRTEQVAISPDGRYVVYAVQEGGRMGLWIRQVLTRSADVEIVPPEVVEFAGLTFSPDDNYVYFVRGGGDKAVANSLFVMPVLGGPAKLLLTGIDSPVSFSPDSHQIAYTRRTSDENAVELRTADADGSNGRLLTILRDAVPFHQAGPAWSPDGRTIAISVMLRGESPRWALEAVSVPDGTVHQIHSSAYKIGRPLWLPRGDELLVALDDQNNHGQLYLIPSPLGKPRRLTNDLADYDDDRIDLTRDGKTAAIVVWDQSGDIWQASAADLGGAQQSESSGVALLSIAARPDGKILATDLNNRLWIMNPDGSQRALFTNFHPARHPLSCGQSVMFLQSTIQGDSQGLMRSDTDGTNVRKLVGEQVGSAVCSADGQFVFYGAEDSPQRIRGISVEGGDPVDVVLIPSGQIESQFTLSPDGTLLAYLYRESGDPAALERLALMPAGGGRPVKVFHMQGEVSTLRWSPDGKALQYTLCVFCAGNATNIWEQPLDGGEPKQLTNFHSGRVFDFTWSADGKQLIIIRGDINGDVVLLSNFR